MTTRRWARLILAVLLTGGAVAVDGQAVPSATLKSGSLAFDARATLGAFTGTTTTLTGAITGAADLGGVRGWVEAPSASLSTANGHRDRDMAGSMEFARYPTIRFDLTGVAPGTVDGDSTAVVLHGRFTIHGQSREVDVPGWLWRRASTVRFLGATPLDVKEYGVGGLSKMLGMLKMNEKILVRIDVTFE
ncbi:MAG TPA: YceI family protein [Gemmatimonadales bacterium]|jgi:polyisoprenoid-binding protein YceI